MASIVKKLLIANRGEIALRVVRTAKEMGISTVAVYSEQDRNSRYVDMADEAYLLSGDTYKDTYLNEDLLIDILHKTGANAVHPGYGFLSEVPSFAQKVEDAGAIWVGPAPHRAGGFGRQDYRPPRGPTRQSAASARPVRTGDRRAHAARLRTHPRLPDHDEAH